MNKKLLATFVSVIAFCAARAAEGPTQPQEGQAAPDFTLTSNEGSSVSLKEFKGKWVVLYFYPKDFTSGCTMEAKNFQRDLSSSAVTFNRQRTGNSRRRYRIDSAYARYRDRDDLVVSTLWSRLA